MRVQLKEIGHLGPGDHFRRTEGLMASLYEIQDALYKLNWEEPPGPWDFLNEPAPPGVIY